MRLWDASLCVSSHNGPLGLQEKATLRPGRTQFSTKWHQVFRTWSSHWGNVTSSFLLRSISVFGCSCQISSISSHFRFSRRLHKQCGNLNVHLLQTNWCALRVKCALWGLLNLSHNTGINISVKIVELWMGLKKFHYSTFLRYLVTQPIKDYNSY